MSLEGKKYQVIDTMDLRAIIKDKDKDGNIVKRTLFTGETTKSGIEKKMSKIEVFSGIGTNKTFSLAYKSDMKLKGTIASFDLDFFAYQNGVNIDKNSKDTYYLAQSVKVETNKSTVNDVKRFLSIQAKDGSGLKIITTDPQSKDEVKVESAGSTVTLTFHKDYVDSEALVSYIGTAKKDNLTIVFSGKAIPKNCELVANTIIYDEEQSEVVGDVYVNFYKAMIDTDYNLAFEMGKPIETPASFEILTPNVLPTGEYNEKKEVGKMVITER